MKNWMVLIFITGTLGISSCQKEDDSLSPEDQAALDGILYSLESASLENDSCLISIQQSDSIGLHLHDSLFHYHQDNFEHHHQNYSHGNNHDDHGHHNGQRDNHNGGMNHNCCDGHHTDEHDVMDELSQNHQEDVH